LGNGRRGKGRRGSPHLKFLATPLAGSCSFATSYSYTFLTEEIAGAQNFDFIPKFFKSVFTEILRPRRH